MLVMMNVDEIRIPTIYTHTPPRKEKSEYRQYTHIHRHGKKKLIILCVTIWSMEH